MRSYILNSMCKVLDRLRPVEHLKVKCWRIRRQTRCISLIIRDPEMQPLQYPSLPIYPDTINSICTIRKPNTSNLVQVSCSWRRRNFKPWRLRGCGICQCPVSSRVIDKVHFVVCVNKICLNVATLTISAIPGPCDCFSLFVVRRN